MVLVDGAYDSFEKWGVAEGMGAEFVVNVREGRKRSYHFIQVTIS